MKKLMIYLLCGLLCLGMFAGCDSKKDSAEPIVLQIAHDSNVGEPVTLAVEEWKKLLDERSDGQFDVQLFPASQLGSKANLTEQVLMGEPIFLLTDGSFLAEYGSPEMSILSMPYVFDNWDQCWKLIETDWFEEKCDEMAEAGIRVLTGNWISGERQLITTQPVRKLADLKGLKIRVPNNAMSVAEFNYFGAASTPMALSECYTAIQNGTVNGQENPLVSIYAGAYYEVCKFVSLTGHVKLSAQWICSEEFFKSLTKKQQDLLITTAKEAGLFNNEKYLASDSKVIQQFKDKGVEVIEMSDAVLQEFKDAIKPLYTDAKLTENWKDKDLFNTVRGLIK